MPEWKRLRLAGLKRCWSCKTNQSRTNFHRAVREADGLTNRCKTCTRAAKVKYLPVSLEKRAAAQKAWNERHPGRTTEIMREWRAANRERNRENDRRYQQAHPEHFRNKARLRRALKKTAQAELVERSAVWDRDAGICGICCTPADPASWHLDHVVPLALGGAHTYANTQVSHPACNMRKGKSSGGVPRSNVPPEHPGGVAA